MHVTDQDAPSEALTTGYVEHDWGRSVEADVLERIARLLTEEGNQQRLSVTLMVPGNVERRADGLHLTVQPDLPAPITAADVRAWAREEAPIPPQVALLLLAFQAQDAGETEGRFVED